MDAWSPFNTIKQPKLVKVVSIALSSLNNRKMHFAFLFITTNNNF